MDKNRKKQVKRYIAWGIAVVLVVLLAVLPLVAAREAEADGPQASILTAQAERRDITRKIVGGGMLASSEKKDLTIPEEVKIKEYLVGNGDVVAEGDAIALVDKVSVMTAITKVQESLDYLAKEIQSTRNDTVKESVNSQVSGVVKIIYAQKGDDVLDVMLEHGSLAVLSLDGLMAVRIQRYTSLEADETVLVELEDGTEVEGTVASNLDGILTVTVEDDDYTPGQTVSVSTEDGDRIGTGMLYIHSSWTAHGYTGIVSDVRVKVGQKVNVDQALLRLKETGQTAEHQKLVDQYHEYEEMMQDLFRMYSTGAVTAPCDGIVSGVDKEGAFMLAAEGGWTLSLLTHAKAEATGFWGYGAQVVSVRQDGLELMADSGAKVITDFTNISVDASAMTRSWSYTGSTKVYTCGANGLLQEAGLAQPGDTLLFVGDEEAIRWIIRVDGSGAKNTGMQSGFQGAVLSKLNSETPEYVYYVAKVTDVNVANDVVFVVQSTAQPIVDPTDKSGVNQNVAMEEDAYYTGWLASGLNVQKDDVVVIISGVNVDYNEEYILQSGGSGTGNDPANPSPPTGNDQGNTGIPGGGMPSGGMTGGFSGSFGGGGMTGGFGGGAMGGGFGGGAVQEEESPTYTQETLTVATVTSQETITLDVTVDEADILLLSVGQHAELTVSPLAGEVFDATITEISNDGVNDGGRTKFTVTVSTQKHSDMYPGMTGTLTVAIDTVEDALVLPVAALVEQGTETVVYTGYDAENETLINPVKVTTGVSDGEYVEVFGIDEGTKVHYAYYDTLVLSNIPQSSGLFR